MDRLFLKATVLLAAIFFAGIFSGPDMAQGGTVTVTGTVTDESGQPLPALTVIIDGTTTGVTTDMDGNYSIEVPADGTLVFSYLGYQTQNVQVNGRTRIDLQLLPDTELLADAVVIGYGTTTKRDMTGSISAVNSDDFNEGLISSPEQLINGKVSGVQITSSGGSPTSGSTIRIRGGASLNASNDPLIVLDGVPLESGGVSGMGTNFLSLINPNDIESMTVLKDASSTAIYGSRASNGVVIITTKKGRSDRLSVTFNTTMSLQNKTRTAEMLSPEQFVQVATDAGYANLLGDWQTNGFTNWEDQIYQTAFGTDNNLSLAGQFTKNFPFRVSVGYYNQDGIVKTDNATRYTGNINLSPSFFDDHLKITLSAKGAINKNRYAQSGTAIYNATVGDPTRPVYSWSDAFGGYSEILSNGTPSTVSSTYNPLGLINQYDSRETMYRIIGNIDVDYKMHFLPELKVHVTGGYDYASATSEVFVPATAAQYYRQGGLFTPSGPNTAENRLFTAYLNYNKEFASIKSRIDITAGYDWQYWRSYISAGDSYMADRVTSINAQWAADDQRHALMSYYARLNWSFDGRYLLTATIRRDGSSRFAPDSRWGTFPSVAVAWNIAQEKFLRDNGVLNNLKLRASWGITGQQDGIGNYGYLPVYYPSTGDNSQYVTGIDGNGNIIYGGYYQPGAYLPNLTWEKTAAWNVGLDFGFLNDRISGSIDWYTRNTRDLLATVPAAAGTNFTRTVTTNVGNMHSQGVELNINATPIDTKDWTWNITANATWQQVKITNLAFSDDAEVTPTLVGTTVDSRYVQAFAVGQTPYSFYVYKQIYDESGKPIEGAYADLNGDGQITTDDRYFYHSPSPDWMLGFSTSVRWKNLTLSTSLRANIGNYAYNATASNNGALETLKYADDALYNLSTSYLQTGFRTRQILSDHYVENASFLKMDNLTLNYNFGRVKDIVGINVSFMVQNVFTITKYSGVDPEIYLGIDQNFYPRPRIYSLGIGLTF